MTQAFIFIYAKEGKIKVLPHLENKDDHIQLLCEGWEHTATVDACKYLEYLHNDCPGVCKEVKSLSTKK